MVVQGIASNPQASNTSSIKEGKGEFGLSKTNPIPVYGIPSNEIYLKQLKTNSGGEISWKRKGSIINRMLYDVEIDELQMNNIAEIKSNKFIVDSLSRILNKHIKSVR